MKNVKQYTIGIIIWIFIASISTVYWAVNGSIWSLFQYLSWNENGISITNQWRLEWTNIKDGTVTEHEIADNSIWNSEIKNNENFTFDWDIKLNWDTFVGTPKEWNDITNKTYVDIKNLAQNTLISSNTNRIEILEQGSWLWNRYYVFVNGPSWDYFCASGYVVTWVNYDSKNDDHINWIYCSKLK